MHLTFTQFCRIDEPLSALHRIGAFEDCADQRAYAHLLSALTEALIDILGHDFMTDFDGVMECAEHVVATAKPRPIGEAA